MNVETIKELARKIAALSAPGNGATDAERDVARAKLQRLLDRHGLTVDAISDEAKHNATFSVRNVGESELLMQCTFFVLQSRQHQFSTPRFWAKKDRRHVMLVHDVTHVEAADIAACFDHYVKILRDQVIALRDEVKRARAAVKNAHHGVIQRFNLFGPPSDEIPECTLSPAEIDAIMRAMRAADGERWERPVAKIAPQLALGLKS